MNELTARQEEFLLLFATFSGDGNAISDASSYFEVSKATVSTIVKSLSESGMLTKERYGAINLSEKGRKYISQKLEQTFILNNWLQNDCGLTPLEAEKTSKIMVSSLKQQAIVGIISNLNHNIEKVTTTKSENIDIKRRKINFSILKLDGKTQSMGDKGFEKPASLRRQKEQIWVVLTPKKLEYRSIHRRAVLRGKLERLWYNHDERWHEATLRSDGAYYIPLEYFLRDNEKTKLRIRARSSVGIFTMPESEAILVIDL